MSGGAAASAGELLNSNSASQYLSYLTLQGYVNAAQRRVLSHYARDQRQADQASAALAEVQATVRDTSARMAQDQRTWTTADARAAKLRTQLVASCTPERPIRSPNRWQWRNWPPCRRRARARTPSIARKRA